MEAGRHAIVTIRSRAGASHAEEVWHQPMSGLELDRKFDQLVVPRLGADRSARVAGLLKGLDAAASIRPLMLELSGG
jgi:hypothetical protein